jgi:toxin ParE1/3/4
MKRIRVSKLAENDLDEIWHDIAWRSGNIKIANSVVDAITDIFPILATNPEAGRSRDDIDPGVRSFPVQKYIVFYRTSGQDLTVSRVIHGMRDQKAAFFSPDE